MGKLPYRLAFAAAGAVLGAVGPAAGQYVPGPYPIEEEFDKEYAMDAFQLSYDRDWENTWFAHDRGFRLAMGSLNVRQWHLNQEVKFAADFTDWFRFLYRYDRYEGLEPLWEERQLNEFELEFGIWRWFKLGLRTEPTFWKRYADGGFTGKFRYDADRYVNFGYTTLDFDNNYSFERSKYDEGYEEIYRLRPRRYELETAWAFPGGFRLRGEGFYRKPSTKYYDYFYGQEPDWARRYAERYASLTLTQALPRNVEVYYEGDWNKWEEARRPLDPGVTEIPLAEHFGGWMTLESHGGGAYYQPPGRHRLRGGGQRRFQQRHYRFPSAPANSYHYEKTETMAYLLWRLRLWKELYLETGYMGEIIDIEIENLSNGYLNKWNWAENRIPITLEYKFGEKYFFKMSSGIDLDERDWGQYLIYDKAYAFVSACF